MGFLNKFDRVYEIKSRKRFVAVMATALVVMIALLGVSYYMTGDNNSLTEENEALFNNGVTPVCTDTGWGYITRSGRSVGDASYSLSLGFSPSSKLALVYGNSNKEFSYIKKSGYVAAGPFESAGRCVSASFYGGCALIEQKETGTYGYIDKHGKLIGKSDYSDGRSFKNCRAAVKRDKLWGYIDKDGKEVIPFIYDNAGDFADNSLAAVKTDGLWGYIDKKNRMVIKPQYTEARDFSNGLAAVRNEDGWQYIDKKGNVKISGDFDDVSDFADNSLAAVCSDGLWGYINKKGEFEIEPQYKNASKFRKCAYAAVETNEGCVIINKRGRIITDKTYEILNVYDDGYAVFSEDSVKYGIMTCRGRVIRKAEYNYVSFDRLYKRSISDRYYE